MNPSLTPAPTTQTPQGVTQVAPNQTPAPAPIPQAPANVGLPAPIQNPQAGATAQGLQNVANFYGIPEKAALASNSAQASGELGKQQLASTQFNAGLTESHLKDQLDPSKYTVNNNPKSPNGISITNSLGQQVDLATYVNLTGSNPAQVLAKSTDPGAQKFVAAYNNMENLMQTMIGASGGDQQAKTQMADYYEANPGLKNMTPAQVTNAFMSQYGQYFGQPQQQPQQPKGVSSTFTSANNPVTSSPYYNQYLQTAFQNNPYQQQLQGAGSISSQLNQLQQQNTGQ